MSLSATAQAVVLLTSQFSRQQISETTPLTPLQWSRFSRWMQERAMTPGDVLQGSVHDVLDDWDDTKISTERLARLLDRGSELAVATEKWDRAGIWLITRFDDDYPDRLSERLGDNAPPVLFGIGNRGLLELGGLAVAGSRDASESDLRFSREIGKAAAEQGYSIVSGCARGVDENAMLGALEADGTSAGVMGHSLLRGATSSVLRPYIMNKNLVLLSPFHPEAGFNAGNLMQRNKYIYCLADAGLVVHSGSNGGTWNGAVECLKNDWVPVWVKRTGDSQAGNSGIVAKGARWLEEAPADVRLEHLFADRSTSAETGDLFSYSETSGDTPGADSAHETAGSDYTVGSDRANLSFYDLFVAKLEALCTAEPQRQDELADQMGIGLSQFKKWADQAVEDRLVVKKGRPIKYQWIGIGTGKDSAPGH